MNERLINVSKRLDLLEIIARKLRRISDLGVATCAVPESTYFLFEIRLFADSEESRRFGLHTFKIQPNQMRNDRLSQALPFQRRKGRDRPFWRKCSGDRKSTRLNSSHRCISY